MIVSLRKWIQLMKFLLFFVLFTYLLFHVLQFLSGLIQPMHRYKEPAGKAVKVFQSTVSVPEEPSVAERLKLFYWYGE